MDIFHGTEINSMSRALDVLAERQRVIANNVANVSTPGYRTQDIAFGDVLKRLFNGGGEAEAEDTAGDRIELQMLSELEHRVQMRHSPGDPAAEELLEEIRALKQEAQAGSSFGDELAPFSVRPDAELTDDQFSDVEIDEEMGKLAETSLMYNAYIQALVKQIGRLRLAVNDRL